MTVEPIKKLVHYPCITQTMEVLDNVTVISET